MRKKLVLISSAAVLATALSVTTVARADRMPNKMPTTCAKIWQHNHMRGHDKLKRLHKMISRLDLSKTQHKQVQEIIAHARPALQHNMQALRHYSQLMRQNARGEHYNLNQVKHLAHKQGQIMANMMVLRVEMRHQLQRVLTKTQQMKLEHMMHHRAAKKFRHY